MQLSFQRKKNTGNYHHHNSTQDTFFCHDTSGTGKSNITLSDDVIQQLLDSNNTYFPKQICQIKASTSHTEKNPQKKSNKDHQSAQKKKEEDSGTKQKSESESNKTVEADTTTPAIPMAIIGSLLGVGYAANARSKANKRRRQRQQELFLSKKLTTKQKTFKKHIYKKHIKTFKPYFGETIAGYIANALATVDAKLK